MPDLALFGAALTSLKTATEIAKTLPDNDLAVEKAEFKLKLADIIGALADARVELAELQETVSAKDARIVHLEQAFAAKDSLVRYRDAMYRVGADGQRTGQPLCLRCWEADHQQRGLIESAVGHEIAFCNVCKSSYNSARAPGLAN